MARHPRSGVENRDSVYFVPTTNKGRKFYGVLSDNSLYLCWHSSVKADRKVGFMKTVNLGDKYTHRLTLRLSDSQMEFLDKVCKLFDVSPSEYIRMTLNASMVSTSESLNAMVAGKALEKVGMSNENVEANINDKL